MRNVDTSDARAAPSQDAGEQPFAAGRVEHLPPATSPSASSSAATSGDVPSGAAP
jgi:hypothetical protein